MHTKLRVYLSLLKLRLHCFTPVTFPASSDPKPWFMFTAKLWLNHVLKLIFNGGLTHT